MNIDPRASSYVLSGGSRWNPLMFKNLVAPDVRAMIAKDDHETLRELLDEWLPADVADLLDELSDSEDQAVFRLLHGPQRIRIFEYLDEPSQRRILHSLPSQDACQVLTGMASDDRTSLLDSMPPSDRERFLGLLSEELRKSSQKQLDYPADSVGRLMTVGYVAVRAHWTVAHVLDHIRRHGQDSETLNVLYVLDADDKLIDDLRIRQILLASPNQTLEELMDHKFVALSATDPQRSAVEVFRHYDRTALPVVDAEGRLLGVVTIDDVLDVAEDAATEDIHKFGGLEALEEPYATTPLLTMVRKRGVWLVVLFLGEMLTATAMGYYEKEIDRAVVLALFVPLIISSGGNSGSQAATLIVRALAVGDVKLGDWPKVLGRELLSGLLLGVLLGVIGFSRVALWSAFTNIYGPHWALVGITVGVSLIGIVLWGSISGSMLPFVLKRLGLDPATSSAPFVATLVDVTGLVIYFTVATIVLHGTLL